MSPPKVEHMVQLKIIPLKRKVIFNTIILGFLSQSPLTKEKGICHVLVGIHPLGRLWDRFFKATPKIVLNRFPGGYNEFLEMMSSFWVGIASVGGLFSCVFLLVTSRVFCVSFFWIWIECPAAMQEYQLISFLDAGVPFRFAIKKPLLLL